MIPNFLSYAGLTALSLVATTRAAHAESASLSVGTSGSTLEDAPAAQARVQLGIFGGMVLLPSSSTLRDPRAAAQDYEKTAFDVGIRAGVYPISYVGAELEGAYIPTGTVDGVSARLFAVRGQGVLQLPTPSLTPFVVAGYGRFFSNSDTLGEDSDRATHFGAGVKLPLGEDVGVRVDLRDTIVDDANDARHYPEFLFGLGIGLGGPRSPRAPAPVVDSDGDSLADPVDACPREPATTANGCPVRDADADGVPDDADRCPAVTGIAPDGCPDPDPDKDGVLAEADRCPEQAETANGFEDADGCPDEVPEEVKQFTGVIQGIEFDFGKVTVRKASLPTLDAAVKVLQDHPSLRIRITGHTDSVGTREVNLERSAGRAAAVKDYLVQQGVDASRIETVGAGPDSPIADNATLAGRQKNRRIEFEILK